MSILNSHPLVTVAIPTLVRLEFLREAIQSALGQRYQNVEVLISDDGNNEKLAAWCLALVASDSRVRYLHTPRPMGLAGNWNYCADQSRGQYLIIIGDDDRLLPNCLEKLMGLADGLDVIFSNHYLIDPQGARLEQETLDFTRRSGREELVSGRLVSPEVSIWRNSIPISSALLRTEMVRELRFKEDLNTPEIELYLRLAGRHGSFVYCPDYLVEYRIHPHSATSTGLWSDKIAPYLIRFPASPETEPHKRTLLESLLPNALGRALASGQKSEAVKLWRSGYYPDTVRKSTLGRFQHLCLMLPGPIAAKLYRGIRLLKRR